MKYPKIKYNKHIIIVTGNIGSGKSYYAEQAFQHGYLVLGRDKLRYMIGAGTYVFMNELEPTMYRMEMACVDELMRTGVNLYIDEVGMTARGRAKYIGIAKMYDYRCISFILPKVQKKVCVERRAKDPHGSFGKATWKKVWSKFNNAYQEPALEEGFDYVYKQVDSKDPIAEIESNIAKRSYDESTRF